MNGQFPKSIILCSLFFALHVPLEAAKLYKWVDESGKVHYSDKIPPTAITGSHSKLSKEGVTVERRGAAKTPEEIAHEAELKRLREEQQRVLEKQQIKDRVLLNTFRTEDDIILARDGKLATYDAQIRIIYENIDRLKNRLISQQNRAALQERQGRKPDEKTLQGIENTQQEIKDSYASILRQENDKKLINEKYAADLKRFRELKELENANLAKADQAVPENKNLLVNTAIPCGSDQECNALWSKARAFGMEKATTRIYVDSEKIFMTEPALKDDQVSITVSRLKAKKDDKELIFLDVQCKKQVASQTWCQSPEAIKIREQFRETMAQ